MPVKSKKINEVAISVEHLSVKYESEPVFTDITFEIPAGNIAAILGPNGSGKTTMIKTILDLVKKDSGNVLIFGKHLHENRYRVAYVPQNFEFDKQFPMTVLEFMNLTKHKGADDNIIQGKIAEVGLYDDILHKRLGTLSGGQMQRVLIAQAILNDPDLLILDEPSTGIDVVGEAAFVQILKHLKEKHNTTILLVSHDVSLVLTMVDTVICLNKKLLCVGSPKSTLTTKKLADLYGNDSHIHDHHKGHNHKTNF